MDYKLKIFNELISGLGKPRKNTCTAILIGRNQLKAVEENLTIYKVEDPSIVGKMFLHGIPFIKVDADDYLKFVYGEIRND